MANLQIRVDDTLKEQAQEVAMGMGLDLSSAIRVFLAQMVKENGFPFTPTNNSISQKPSFKDMLRSMPKGEPIFDESDRSDFQPRDVEL